MSKTRIRQAFSAAAHSYASAATVQKQVAATLADRLLWRIKKTAPRTVPNRILDVGCGTGFAHSSLNGLFPDAELISLDLSEAMLRQSQISPKICADADALPLTDHCIDLLWSSLTWQWCDLSRTLNEAQRVMSANGQLAFTTLTEGTYHELRHAFSGIRSRPLPLLSIDRVLDAVGNAGFHNITADAERIIVHYPSLKALLTALRDTGTQSTSGDRQNGLIGKAKWRAIETAYAQLATTEGLPLTYDVLYVTAQKDHSIALHQ